MNQKALKIQFVQRGVGSEDKAKQLRLAGRGKRQHKYQRRKKKFSGIAKNSEVITQKL